MYSGGAQDTSHRNWGILWISSVSPGECQDNSLKQAMITSFSILSNSSFVHQQLQCARKRKLTVGHINGLVWILPILHFKKEISYVHTLINSCAEYLLYSTIRVTEEHQYGQQEGQESEHYFTEVQHSYKMREWSIWYG